MKMISPQPHRSKKIMARKEQAVLLSKDICEMKISSAHNKYGLRVNPTHRYTECTNQHLHACDDHERLVYSGVEDPVVRTPSESEAEHVLEDKKTCKGFDGDIPYEPLKWHVGMMSEQSSLR